MIEHAQEEAPRECCGLLTGAQYEVRTLHRLVNEAAGDDEYFVAEGLIKPFVAMRRSGEELLGIYHSHPAAPAVPSAKDLARNFYPETPHFIVSLAQEIPLVRAFQLQRWSYSEVAWLTTIRSEPSHPNSRES